MRLHIEDTRDEFGKPRFFVADENADWISDPFDTREEAVAEMKGRSMSNADYERGRKEFAQELHALLYPEQHPPGDPYHDPEHMFWQQREITLEPVGPDEVFEWSADTIEWVAQEIEKEIADRVPDDLEAVSRYRRERDEARAALDVVLIERNEAREHLDDAIELAASAVRAHTRAIHHLAGNCTYPEDEQAATGSHLGNALLDCRKAREALGGGDD